jgi:dCMP deaminase
MTDIVKLLRDAYLLAEKHSEDPVTRNGAILVNQDNVIIGQGANRLPDRVKRDPSRLERPEKYDHIIHAEQNAIADAARQGNATANSTMYCPWAACTACARLIIQSGVTKVVTHKALLAQSHLKWPQEIATATKMLLEAGIEYFEFDGVIGGVEHLFNGKLWTP